MEQLPKPPVYLRALDVSDLEQVYAWHNDSALYENLGGNFRFVSRTAEEEWLSHRSVYSANEVNLAICISNTHEHIGNVYLRDIDWMARRAEFHIFIGAKTYRGHGYGESAMQQVLAHGFGELGLQRIYLFVLASNEQAIRLYRKCGLKEEGRLRQHTFKKNHYEDMLVMGILSLEWESRKGD